MKEDKGISLIVLVITIIVVIILAGAVIISLANNNPISQANKATFLSDLRNFETELNLYETKQFLDELGMYDITKLQADETSVTYDSVVVTDKTINDLITTFGKSTKYVGQFVVVDGKLVYQGSDTNRQIWSMEAGVKVEVLGEPKVTMISPLDTVVSAGTDIVYTIQFSSNAPLTIINLEGNVEVLDDSGVALVSQPGISFGTIDGLGVNATISVDITIETDGLLSGAYKLKIKSGTVTNADNISNIQDTISLIGFDIDNTAPENPIMLADPSIWTIEDVTVTINYSEDTSIKEYSLDGTNWNNYTSPVVVTNNITIYSRGKDILGNESGVATLTVTNIDRDAPTVSYGTNGGSGETANTTVTVSDVGTSSINISTLQYVWDIQNSTTPTSGWAVFTNSQTLTKTGVTGTYYLWIKASDNAGNNVVSKTNSFVLIQPVVANKPVLSIGMTAKKWNGSSWDTVSNPETDTSWYNYTNKEWGNAQTADGSMWVWIPRYEYKITTPHMSTEQTIAVNFLENTSTTVTSGYTLHSAFTFGSTELTGLWVAKFEASGTSSAIDLIPGASSLKSLTVTQLFTACRNMETNSRYGWGTSGIGIDTHLIKNTEWASVAYLSQSIYGKNSEVWKNPTYITGQSGTNVSGETPIYSYDNVTYGVNVSTTGNIYGVYDMNGGTQEYIAAYVNNGDASLATYGASLVNASSQYKDLYFKSTYDTASGNYALTSGRKGDAVYETSSVGTGSGSWFTGYSATPCSNSPYFSRSQMFGFSNFYGGGGVNGFRPVIVISGTF
ncbi:MAG: hypothetical protein PHD15_00040 [Clostridia bacterium]|nr:hypothetical protein [Clostridia bacterium]MDD4386142.1 hypothetical protein [Clostridia bacterium]